MCDATQGLPEDVAAGIVQPVGVGRFRVRAMGDGPVRLALSIRAHNRRAARPVRVFVLESDVGAPRGAKLDWE